MSRELRNLWLGVGALLLMGCADADRSESLSLEGVQLHDLEGRLHPLVDDSRRVRIINFWATWCAPCREEMPDLQRMDEMLDDRQYQVIGVTVDRDLNLVREFMLKYQIRFEQRSDPAMALASGVLGVRAYPETVLVDADGKVVDRVVGVRPWGDPEFVRRFLEPAIGKD